MREKIFSPISRAIILAMIILLEFFAIYVIYAKIELNLKIAEFEANLINFTTDNLKIYNGLNPEMPIYLALNGYVYDVTPGKKYYEKGGTYNYLAGRDSSEDLNLFGGEIIVRKYKVIGRLVD